MLSILLAIVIGLTTSFIGSFLCFVLWMHYHLEDLWDERHTRLELKRHYKRMAKLTPEQLHELEGKPSLRLVMGDGEQKQIS